MTTIKHDGLMKFKLLLGFNIVHQRGHLLLGAIFTIRPF